jgi:peptide/nickel transport system substrate-binding protein
MAPCINDEAVFTMIRHLARRVLGMMALTIAAQLALAASANEVKATRLTIGTKEFPDILSYDFSLRVASQFALGPALRPMVLPTPDLNYACELCVTLPSTGNGLIKPGPNGGLVVTYELRPDWFWGDGIPVTSKDFAFTIALAQMPDVGFVRQSLFADITKVDASDPHRLVLTFGTTRYDAGQLRITPLPEHLERPILARVGAARYARESLYVTKPTEPGLWNGPYLVNDFAMRDHLVYRRNPYWKGTRPQFDQVIIRAIDHIAALEQNLLSGDIDYASGLSPQVAYDLLSRQDPRFQIDVVGSTGRLVFNVNLKNSLLAKRDIRQALVKAIDRKTITERRIASGIAPTNSFLSVRDPAYSDQTGNDLAYDPDGARALLDAHGFKLGADGIRRDSAGLKLSIELMIGAGDPAAGLLATLVQSFWKAIGVETRLNPRQTAEVDRLVRELSYSALAVQAWNTAPGDPPRLNFHSASIPTKANNFAGGNQSGYVSAEMDQLIDAARLEIDAAKRQALMVRIQALYAHDLPEIPLFTAAAAYVRPKYLTGVPLFAYDLSTYRIENWRSARP